MHRILQGMDDRLLHMPGHPKRIDICGKIQQLFSVFSILFCYLFVVYISAMQQIHLCFPPVFPFILLTGFCIPSMSRYSKHDIIPEAAEEDSWTATHVPPAPSDRGPSDNPAGSRQTAWIPAR